MKSVLKKIIPPSALAAWRAFRSARLAAQRGRIAKKVCADLVQRNRQPIRIELGSGPVSGKSGWVTFDSVQGADVVMDLTGRWPLPDESVAEIYSSHFLEHLSDPDLDWVLEESRRVLIPGGVFDAAVPNARLYIKAYVDGADLYSVQPRPWMPAVRGTVGLAIVNYIAYLGGEHRRMFDEASIVVALQQAGFSEVSLREFRPDRDLANRSHESLYVIARKAAPGIR